MDFKYTVKGVISVSENDLNEMAELVKEGASAEEIVGDYIAGLDDCEFYNMFAFDYKIINEVRRRAREL